MNEIVKPEGLELKSEVFRHVKTASLSTWKIGGYAEYFTEIDNDEDLALLLRYCSDRGVDCHVVGGGSNILFGDGMVSGFTVKLGKNYRGFDFWGNLLKAGGGASLPLLSAEAAKRSLAGLEFAAGIPGTAGAAAVINAGAHGSCVADVFVQAVYFDKAGGRHVAGKNGMSFGYRSSALKGKNAVVTYLELQLFPGETEDIESRRKEYLALRREKQPQGLPNAGSVFKNPPGDSAGRLIEEAGLKGLSCGGAEVSGVHANFIVNRGGASASDILELVETVREKVYAQSGVMLEEEFVCIGSSGKGKNGN